MTGRSFLEVATLLAPLLLGIGAARAETAVGEIRFGFDSSQLPQDATSTLDDAVMQAELHPDARLVLAAYCDPIGSPPYNVGLAIRRAEAVRDRLAALGVPGEQITFVIFGEDGERRATYAEDRRVSVALSRDPVAAVVDRTFAEGGTAVIWGESMTTAQLEAPPTPIARR